jgi:hypothetical protein
MLLHFSFVQSASFPFENFRLNEVISINFVFVDLISISDSSFFNMPGVRAVSTLDNSCFLDRQENLKLALVIHVSDVVLNFSVWLHKLVVGE